MNTDLHLAPVARPGIDVSHLHRSTQYGISAASPLRRRLRYSAELADLPHERSHRTARRTRDRPDASASARRPSNSSACSDRTEVKITRATASSSATCGLVNE